MGASSLQQVINYVTEANFDHNSALTEFTGTSVRHKDLRPANALFHSKFETKDANWGSGTLTGTLNGSAAITAGKLSINTSTGYLDFSGTSNAPSGNTGCVRFTFTPDYTGSATNFWISLAQAASNINNLIRIGQIGTTIRVDIYDSTGGILLTSQTGNGFNPVSGQTYEIEFNWNASNAYLFVNGVLTGGVKTVAAGTQAARGLLRVGANYTSPSTVMDGTIDDLIVFDAVQHTANYTPGVVIPYQYSKDRPWVMNKSGSIMDALEGIEETDPTSQPANASLEFVINFSGQDYYWNGSAWSVWTGGAGNTAAVLNANKAAFDASVGGTGKVKMLLVSDGATRAEVSTITFSYNFFNTQSEPLTTTVWGFYRDISGIGIPDATVTFMLKRADKQYREAGDSIIEKKVVRTTDSQGRFEADLIRSSEYGVSGGVYILTIVKSADELETSVLDPTPTPATAIEFTVGAGPDQNITSVIDEVA